jgi:quinol-cytochrome oxidoreductase complex cytochrome b subunit/coenzyme F420-reducing hydrogenase delta subunit
VSERLKGAAGQVDAVFNRLYHWRYNPLYQSGTLVVVNLLILLITGVYLLIFYRIGRPFDSVAGMTDQIWTGRWIRSLHRYASDIGVVLIAIHALRMWIQHRATGPRAKAWWSGVLLLFSFMVCGWTGYVMVWDAQAQALAVAGAQMLDALPLFSETITRTFAGDRPLPGAFFFLNLFLHIALPVGLALLLWIHLSRIARPMMWPPKKLAWGFTVILVVGSVGLPVAMGTAADPLRVPDPIALDVFFNVWLPWAMQTPPLWVWGATLSVWGALFIVPWLSRPMVPQAKKSIVEERFCTGCTQCSLDCPYDAIHMIPRVGEGPSPIVALVDPELCVSCGICAGSCAPMRVGPPGRTGRNQLVEVKEFIATHPDRADDIVVVACSRGAGNLQGLGRFHGAPVFSVDCAGSIHTSVLEYLVRSGFAGVMVAACPPRDCWNREGAIWLEQRMFHDREAELQARVDRSRMRLIWAGHGERGLIAKSLDEFGAVLRESARAQAETSIDLERPCETALSGTWELEE